jgi:hypothetical protein
MATPHPKTMSLASCATQLKNAVTCVETDPNKCGKCFDVREKFDESLAYHLDDGSLASNLEMEFRQTLAVLSKTDPGFCAESNARMCDYHRNRMVRPPQLEHTGTNAICCISSQF